MFISLSDIYPEISECFAHRKSESEKKETLVEHTELCQKYFWNLIEKKELIPVFERMKRMLLDGLGNESIGIFEEMLLNVASFHDLGKINPIYQSKKMGNGSATETKISTELCNELGSQHSILSAIGYLDYYLEQIKCLEKDERKKLGDFAYINSFVIAKHHGKLKEFMAYVSSFIEDWEDQAGINAMRWFHEWEESHGRKASIKDVKLRKKAAMEKRFCEVSETMKIAKLGYTRLLYSLLVTADYYATTEYMNGVEVRQFGEINNIAEMRQAYDATEVMQAIRKYQRDFYPMPEAKIEKQKDINILRTELFLDAEQSLLENATEQIVYFEAPTGSGKSNTAMNLSFRLLELDESLKKIYYVYPFNTLVEQNSESLKKVFGNRPDIMSNIAVVNSLVPMKENDEDLSLEERERYQKIFLDRQFLNYPIVLTTHVTLFKNMFGKDKEALFGFLQLCNSVIVLDEIQSYRNEIWSEIIRFLKGYAHVLNIKIIIMSATLPDLELLTDEGIGTINLIKNREKYFGNAVFRQRVVPNFELLAVDFNLEILKEHVCSNAKDGKKILIEFIKKGTAYEFYDMLIQEVQENVLLMTGDTSILERKIIIEEVKASKSVILIATQVIEAGVDIDMDIGYKDISKIDSEEQFMGRINRSCFGIGIVYFFDLDKEDVIYRNDIRTDKSLTLRESGMKDILKFKNFPDYYRGILDTLKKRGKLANDDNIDKFFSDSVGLLNFINIENRMRLINDSMSSVYVFLARSLKDENGCVLEGIDIWDEYSQLLKEQDMEYAEKMVKLADVKSRMNGFMYQINSIPQVPYNDQIGDIFYIEDGEKYFENGIFNRNRFEEEVGLFIF